MGYRGTGNFALGRAAVICRATWRRAILAFVLPALLAGCTAETAANSAGPITGAAVGLGLGGVTANPLIGYAAGVGTQAAVTALQKYLSRKLHQGEQDNIAAAVGQMQPGQSAAWRISYDIPIGNAHGDVTVTRIIANKLTACKEAAFTVVKGNKPDAPRGVYVTSACQASDGRWRWAEAEPAVDRWGFLQ